NIGTLDPDSLNNLVGDGSCSALLSGDPQLGPLSDNGGPTQTFALLATSPAIDAGNDTFCESTDQRGVARPQGAHCDIGAYEYVFPVTPSPTSTDTPTYTPTASSTPTFTPTFTPTATSTPALPGAFNKFSPSNKATDQSINPALSWGSSAGAASYQYCYDTTNDNACSSWISSGPFTSINLSGLSPNTTYYWQVRALNSTGTAYANGSSTAFWSFKTMSLPAAFNKSSPASGSLKQPTNPILKWAASSGAASYQYCYDTVNNNVCDTSWVSTSSTNASLSSLSNNTIYYWQVRAVNLGGITYANAGAWWNFKVILAPPTLTSPINNATRVGARPTFTWSDPNTSGVSGYTIQISTSAAFSSILMTGDVTTPSYTPAKNLPARTLYWRVEVRGANGPSPWSLVYTFSP
ncbi:MAG TPA: choice-of-anchor Q domain-containing protein, partial [Anaerolineales bacterium]|nr:choice-of-anchor Q domain-containing protein [Anaerolineales bacterium]